MHRPYSQKVRFACPLDLRSPHAFTRGLQRVAGVEKHCSQRALRSPASPQSPPTVPQPDISICIWRIRTSPKCCSPTPGCAKSSLFLSFPFLCKTIIKESRDECAPAYPSFLTWKLCRSTTRPKCSSNCAGAEQTVHPEGTVYREMDARENSGHSIGFASEEELKTLTLSSLFKSILWPMILIL